MNMKIKKLNSLVYRYYDELKNNYLGEQNGILAEELADRMGIKPRKQRYILQAINESDELPRLVSTCGKIYMCNTEQECVRAFMNEIRSGLTRLQKGKKMAKKVGLNGQYKLKLGEYYKDFVTVFEEQEVIMTEKELIAKLKGSNSAQSKKELAEFHKQKKEKDERER